MNDTDAARKLAEAHRYVRSAREMAALLENPQRHSPYGECQIDRQVHGGDPDSARGCGRCEETALQELAEALDNLQRVLGELGPVGPPAGADGAGFVAETLQRVSA